MSVEIMNQQFAIDGKVSFVAGKNGQPRADLTLGGASASVYLLGATLTSFQDEPGRDIIWVRYVHCHLSSLLNLKLTNALFVANLLITLLVRPFEAVSLFAGLNSDLVILYNMVSLELRNSSSLRLCTRILWVRRVFWFFSLLSSSI